MKVANFWFDLASKILLLEFPQMEIKRYHFHQYEDYEVAAKSVLDSDLIIVGFVDGNNKYGGDTFVHFLQEHKYSGKILRLSIEDRRSSQDRFGNPLIDDIDSQDELVKDRIIPVVRSLLGL